VQGTGTHANGPNGAGQTAGPSFNAAPSVRGRLPSKRELRAWRAVRIDQQAPLDVAIEFDMSLLRLHRLVRWIDGLRANELAKQWDAKQAYEALYHKSVRAFEISTRTDTKKTVVKRKGTLNGEPAERVSSHVKSRNAGNPAFLKLCVELADRLTSFGVDRPSRESARMANESERQNIEAIDALRRSGAIGSVTRTERIEFTPAPSAGQSTPERLATDVIRPTGVGVCVLVDGGAQTPAATTHAPPHFSPADFGPDVVPPLTSIPSPDAPTASPIAFDSQLDS
jgi:hypothetical protein